MECMQVYLCGIQYYTLYFYTFKHLLLNPFFFPVSHLKIFSTIYSPQHCFSRLSRARFNFLNLSIHSFPFFFFWFQKFLYCCLSYAHCSFPFILGSRQGFTDLFECLSFFGSSPIVSFSFTLSSSPAPPAWHGSSSYYHCASIRKACLLRL